MRSLTIDIAIRIGLLVLLAYWSLKVIGPFVTILLWSGILTVALYPVFNWLARMIGSKTLAAATITMLSLMIVLGPVTWLGFAMIGAIELLVKGGSTQGSSQFQCPRRPSEAGLLSERKSSNSGRRRPVTPRRFCCNLRPI
jgi:predicted PurR-regulated permease PerM